MRGRVAATELDESGHRDSCRELGPEVPEDLTRL
jgi:hypothetical protein